MRLPFRSTGLVLAAALALPLVGCRDETPRIERPNRPRLTAKLARATTCTELEDALRANARAHVEQRAYELDSGYGPYGYGYPIDFFVTDAGVAVGAPTSSASNADSNAGSRPSETNVQIAGVDELDFVDTTGARTYLLHDQTLHVLDSSPASGLHELGTVPLEGWPRGLTVAGDRAVIVTEVYGSSSPTLIAPTGGDATSLPYPSGPSGVRITLLDITPDVPVVIAERVLEGSLVDARRHDRVMRVVVRRAGTSVTLPVPEPQLYGVDGIAPSRTEWTTRVVAYRDAALASIEAMPLEALLPDDFVRVGGGWEKTQTPCDSVYLPDPGATRDGLVTVLGFDVNAPATSATTSLVGDAAIVHASHDALVLTYIDGFQSSPLAFPGQPTTVIHRFGLDGIATPYEASGEVVGTIDSPYWIDATKDRTRVVTHGSSASFVGVTWEGPSSSTVDASVGTTEPDGTVVRVLAREASSLVEVGATPALAPGEIVQAVRFLGSKAYVVTFRRVDPLFVVDLGAGDVPRVLGELELPGFSTYVRPLDSGHLLTIGLGGDSSGWTSGLALRVFDVRNPRTPSVLHELVLDAWSSATYQPHDFVFDEGTGLLALPMTRYSPTYRSELDLFRVSVEGGIVPAGAVDHAAFAAPCTEPTADEPYPSYPCGYFGGPALLRGVFLSDGLLAVGDSAVTSHALDALMPPLADVRLPVVRTYYPYPIGL